MTAKSKHLDRIITNFDGSAYLHVVFVDTEKYSLRKRAIQKKVIDRFAECLNKALTRTSEAEEYIKYTQKNKDINFHKDIIKLPTGDGAAIVFSFIGLHDIHLFFAKCLLEEIHQSNTKCGEFEKQGWCDCHPNFGIRVGISEGNGLVFKDVNGNYNVAGEVINMASRVMDVADSGQIIFTAEAHNQFTQEYPNLKTRFTKLENVRIKTGIITVYQYTGEGEEYVEPKEVMNFWFLTQSDLKNGLLPIADKLDILTRLVEEPSGSLSLEGEDKIYGAVVESIKKAEHIIRIVRLGSRPKVKDTVLKAIAERILGEQKVRYEIVVVLNPNEELGGFVKSHKDILRRLRKAREGAHPRYHPRVLVTDKPICFDTLIVDRRDVGIGFTRSRSVKDMQNAILFQNNLYMAENFADWFRNIWDEGNDFDKWFDELEKK